MGYIKALASNSNSLDGLDIHCATIDELAAIKNRDLYDLIKQGMAARAQPLLFTISTNGFVRDGIFDAQYKYAADILEGKAENEHFISFIYELDSITEWDDENCWKKANPGLDTIKSRDYLRQMVQKAKDDPSFKPTVLVKDFKGSDTLAKEIQDYVKRRTAPYKYPRIVEFRDSLPKTTSGKIIRKML